MTPKRSTESSLSQLPPAGLQRFCRVTPCGKEPVIS
jgi:hypothetical protein